jgi:Transposase DDE domain
MLIDPDAFEACFSAWAQSFAEAFDREVVAIDGKTLRRSFDRGRAQGPLHLVSASEQGLALGQREVDGKSNEITAIPALLETLSLKNCIVTLDAMGCQKTIAGRILERGADYLLVLKANPQQGVPGGEGVGTVLLVAPRPSRCSMPSTTVMAAWSAGACSSARKPPAWKRCAPGPGCAPCWRWKPSAELRQGRGRDPLLPVKLP